jgi:hypothetical protein
VQRGLVPGGAEIVRDDHCQPSPRTALPRDVSWTMTPDMTGGQGLVMTGGAP